MKTAAQWLIESGGLAVPIYGVAILAAWALLRFVPAIRGIAAESEAGRLASVDGLRGLLGLGVFVHHAGITWFFLHTGTWVLPQARALIHLGQTSVALFFMITAFLFWGRVLDQGARLNWRTFVVARLFRLAPVYLLMLALLWAATMLLARPVGSPADGPVLMPLLHWLAFTLVRDPDIGGYIETPNLAAGVIWSLRYEWLFYAALPVMAVLVGRGAWRPAVGMAAILGALLLRFGLHEMRFYGSILETFAGGMVAAHAVRWPGFARIARQPAAGIVAVLALLSVTVGTNTAYSWQATLGLGVFFTVVAGGHDLGGLLRLRVLRWLGDITYPIYLLHGLLLAVLFRGVFSSVPGPAVFLATVIVAAAVLVVLCSVVFAVIERPAIAAGRRHHGLARPRGEVVRVPG